MPVIIYRPLKSPCTKSQATSSLIKSVRLRRLEDSIYWATHLHHYFPDQLYLLNRRSLIIAAEDNSVVGLQVEASNWYQKAQLSTNSMASLESVLPLIYKLCKTRNWWEQKDTQTYILSWKLGEKVVKHRHQTRYSFADAIMMMDTKLKSCDRKESFAKIAALHMVIRKSLGYKGGSYAHFLRSSADLEGNQHSAAEVAAIPARYSKDLSAVDDNYLGQALYRLCGFEMGDQTVPGIDEAELAQLASNALYEVKTTPRVGPSWALDGIHTTGGDSRFAGALPSMVGCCNVFNRVGVLDPNIPWIKTDWNSKTLYDHTQPPYPYVD